MSKETIIKAKINLIRDMIFKCDDMGEMKLKDCYIDETIKKDNKLGPNAVYLLAHALLGCVSASFIHCLNLRNFTLDDLEAEAEVEIGRNKKGFLRITKVSIDLKPKIDDPAARKRAAKRSCPAPVFQQDMHGAEIGIAEEEYLIRFHAQKIKRGKGLFPA